MQRSSSTCRALLVPSLACALIAGTYWFARQAVPSDREAASALGSSDLAGSKSKEGSPLAQTGETSGVAQVATPGSHRARVVVEETAGALELFSPADMEAQTRVLLAWYEAPRYWALGPEDSAREAAAMQALEANPELALELLVDGFAKNERLLASVGEAFRARGLAQQATETLALAFALSPRDRKAFAALVQVSPERALEAAREFLFQPGSQSDAALGLFYSEALYLSGQLEGCRSQLQRSLEWSPMDQQLLDLLGLVDPEAAAARYSSLAEGNPDAWAKKLYCFLDSIGEPERAIAVMLRELARKPGNLDVIEHLGTLAPKQAFAQLRLAFPAMETNDRVAEAFHESADALWETGDSERAIAGWVQAFERYEPNWDGTLEWPAGLEENAPDKLIQLLESRASAHGGPDFHGRLAGLYWRLGKEDQARDMWRTALTRFPAVSAWQANLDAAEVGDEPAWLWD